jgi:hypothetical protein
MNWKNVLIIILDAVEYFLHLVTVLGAAALIAFAVLTSIIDGGWAPFLLILNAIVLIFINVAMRVANDKRTSKAK